LPADRSLQRNSETFRSQDNRGGNSQNVPDARRNSIGRGTDSVNRADQFRTGTYPPRDSENSAAKYRDPNGSNKLSLQDRASGRSRETPSRETSRYPSFEDRGRDTGNVESKDRRSAVPFQGRAANDTNAFSPPNSRRGDGISPPSSRNSGQPAPPSGSGRSLQDPGQGNPLQFRNQPSDRSSRGQFDGRNYSPPSKDDRSSADRAASSSTRSARDGTRATAQKGDTSQRAVTQGRRDTRPQPKTDNRDGDNRSNRRDKDDPNDNR